MIRLLIADDHPIVREGLKRILAESPDIQLAGEAVDGNEVLSLCENDDFDVMLLDISMPGPGFLEILQRLEAKHPLIRILVLSMHPEDHYAIRAIKAGAAGYLTKDHSPEELAKAVRRVYRGFRYITPSLAEDLATLLKADGATQLHEKLSNREYQVFHMIGSGRDTKTIAAQLSLDR